MSGHRGLGGELTVRVRDGEAAPWGSVARVRIRVTGNPAGTTYAVEHARTYRDRLVLKLAGVEDATRAAQLRGGRVDVPADALPPQPPGRFLSAELIGCRVIDEGQRSLGRVRDVMPTRGTDLLVVARDGSSVDAEDDLLIPITDAIIERVDRRAGRIRVRLPAGLLELNRGEGEP